MTLPDDAATPGLAITRLPWSRVSIDGIDLAWIADKLRRAGVETVGDLYLNWGLLRGRGFSDHELRAIVAVLDLAGQLAVDERSWDQIAAEAAVAQPWWLKLGIDGERVAAKLARHQSVTMAALAEMSVTDLIARLHLTPKDRRVVSAVLALAGYVPTGHAG
jgi:hypothetical protein